MGVKSFVQKNPVTSYFTLTFIISWFGAFALVGNKLIHGAFISKLNGILMFPIMLLGPSLSGIILTGTTKGKAGIRDLFARFSPKLIPGNWLLALLITPFSMLFVLILLSHIVSIEYTPNFFLVGFLFGIPAGILEEIGWMGFAFPNMNRGYSALLSGILLGLIWGLWHLPVIDFLGTASPHAPDLTFYFLSFIIVMTAMRVIIVWTYCNTKSLLLTQLMHISSTGFLVMLSPSPMSTHHEPIWYLTYSIGLWIIVICIIIRFGRNLVNQEPDTKSIAE